MRFARLSFAWACVAILGTGLGCGSSSKQVSRIAEDSTTDLSGRWNDTDSRLVSEEMIQDCLARPWKQKHIETTGKKPTVIVGIVRNKSSEQIAVGTFIGDIERTFVNSGQVDVVASAEERETVRDERADQQSNASEETMKQFGREKGADYMLGGVINTITDEEKGEKVVFYQVDLNLIDLESNSKVWLGQKKIKKYIGHKKVSY
jgi:PBP1b-binding outer membrane lipoprotein LpoB